MLRRMLEMKERRSFLLLHLEGGHEGVVRRTLEMEDLPVKEERTPVCSEGQGVLLLEVRRKKGDSVGRKETLPLTPSVVHGEEEGL